MQWWVWLIIVVVIIVALIGGVLAIQARRRTGGVKTGRNEDAGVHDVPGPDVRAPWWLRCHDARGDPCGWPRASSSAL